DDNIDLHESNASSGGIDTGNNHVRSKDDFVFTFSPGLQITKASTLQDSHTALSIDYTPSFLFYVNNPDFNSIDHAAKFNSGYGFTKLTLTLAQEFTDTSGGVVDVGSRVSQDNYRTAL